MRRLALVLALLAAAGCGPAAVQAASRAPARPAAMPALPKPPPTLLGLTAGSEQVADAFKQGGSGQYLAEVSLWTLRDPAAKLLQATLEIGRLRPDTPYASSGFRASVAGQIGSEVPLQEQLGGTTVFITAVNRLALAIWFRGPVMYVLSVRQTFGTPKALIREALKIR